MTSYRPNFILVGDSAARPLPQMASRPAHSLFPQGVRFAVPEHLTAKPSASSRRPQAKQAGANR